MIKKILSYGFVEGISKGLNKLTILFIPLLLTTDSFGKIGLIISLELVLPVISLLGLERAVLRFYSDKNGIKKIISTVISVITFTHLFLGLLWVLLYFYGLRELFGLSIYPDIILVLILVYLQAIILIRLNKLRVESNHYKYFISRIFFQLGKIILIFSFILLFENYLAYLLGAILSSILVLLYIYFTKENPIEKGFEKATFISLLSFSWPFIFHGFAGKILGTFDKFILEAYATIESVGQYTFSYAIGSAVTFIFIGLSVYIEPLVYKEVDKSKREQLLNKYLGIALIMGSILTGLLIFSSELLIPVFYKNEYILAIKYIPLIAIAHLFLPFYTISNYQLSYEKKTKSIASISISCSIINLVLNFLLIPKIGIEGAIFSTIISYALLALIFTFITTQSKKVFVFRISLLVIFVLMLFLQITIGFSHYLLLLGVFLCSLYFFRKYLFNFLKF